jgi:hypothetical protein
MPLGGSATYESVRKFVVQDDDAFAKAVYILIQGLFRMLKS